jgi:predicted ATPase
MDFRILGPFEVVGSDGRLDLVDDEQRSVLAYLALQAARPVRPEDVPEAPAAALRTLLRSHGVDLDLDRSGYVLDVHPTDVDACQFELQLTAADEEDDPSRRIFHLDTALDLWRGRPLDDVAGGRWVERQAARLADLRRRALARRCGTLRVLGRGSEAAAHLGSVEASRPDQPVVTFLMTDLEDSTRLWAEHTDAMPAALEQHDALLDDAVAGHGGTVIKHTGDGANAVFADPVAAVNAAVDAQRALDCATWSGTPSLRARMGVHTGPVIPRAGDYFGMAPNVAARLRDAGHGGQTLVSSPAVRAIADRLPDDVRLTPLGVHRLRGIPGEHRIYQVVHRELRRRFPPPRTLDAAAGVTAPHTSFVGRTEELSQLGALIGHPGTVTLVGPGGVGKTRLALEVAAEVAHRFRDGARLIDLAPVAADAVPTAVAAGLGLVRRGERSYRDRVIDWLGRKHLLLVVDNCEHVVDVVGPLVRDVARSTNEVTVLCTSRQPLGFLGEVTVPVEPLAVPDSGSAATPEESSAVRLFVERVEASRPGLRVVPEQLDQVSMICRRLDGIPLAIELAAARARSMSLHDLSANLDVSSSLLATTAPDHPRHATLLRTIQWSYDLLTPGQRALFDRLSVFSGSWTAEAARAVCLDDAAGGRVRDTLTELAERSMIVPELGPAETRYRLLSTLRDFGAERLAGAGHADVYRARHADFYVDGAEAASAGLRTADEVHWVRQLDTDNGNLRSAHLWAIEQGDVDLSARLLVAMWNYALQRLSAEHFRWVDEAMAALPLDDHPLAAELWGAAALGAWMRGDLQQCMRACRAAFDAEDRLGTGTTLPARMAIMLAGAYASDVTDPELQAITAEVPRRFLEVVDWSREAGDSFWRGYSMSTGSHGMMLSGDPQGAAKLATRAVDVARQAGCPTLLAWAHYALAIALPPSEATRAEDLLEDGVGMARSVRSNLVLGVSLTQLATLRRRRGHPAPAISLLLELVDRWDRLGTIPELWHTIREAAMCLALLGMDQPAARLLSAVDLAGMVMPVHPADRPELVSITGRMRERLGDDGFAAASAAGTDLSRAAATVLASRALADARDLEPVPA